MKSQGLSCTIGTFLRFLIAAIMLGCLAGAFFPSTSQYCLIAFGFLYLMYWIDIFCINTTFKMLRNRSSISSLHQKLVDMKLKGTPSITWNMVCYHYETRTRAVTTTDSDGRTSTRYETYEERVNTWYGSESFHFDTWTDMSPDTLNIEDHRYIRWKMEKTFNFADDYTQHCYHHQKSTFEESNKWRDTHYNFEETFHIDGFVERMISSSDGTFPWQMSVKVYLVTCIFLFELAYSAWLKGLATPKSYTYCKVFHCYNKQALSPGTQIILC